MNGCIRKTAIFHLSICLAFFLGTAVLSNAQTKTSAEPSENKVITEADCTAEKLGSTIPVSAIGEPVSGVTLNAPAWTAAAGSGPAYCTVNGAMAPVSKEANAKSINFRVVLPASWSRRAAQMGGGGMNGTIPNLMGGADMGPGPIACTTRICHLRQRFRTPDGFRYGIRPRQVRRSEWTAARRYDAGRTAACRRR